MRFRRTCAYASRMTRQENTMQSTILRCSTCHEPIIHASGLGKTPTELVHADPLLSDGHDVTVTARPGVVFSAIGYCDSKYEHEHRAISNGETAYVYSAGPTGRDAEAVHRDGAILRITCVEDDPAGDSCTGHLEFDLSSTGDLWTSDADAINLLVAYGKPVER